MVSHINGEDWGKGRRILEIEMIVKDYGREKVE